MSSVLPTMGSPYGGTEITISGINFPVTDGHTIQVYLGEDHQYKCQIDTITATEITCTIVLVGTELENTTSKIYLDIDYGTLEIESTFDFTFDVLATMPSIASFSPS